MADLHSLADVDAVESRTSSRINHDDDASDDSRSETQEEISSTPQDGQDGEAPEGSEESHYEEPSNAPQKYCQKWEFPNHSRISQDDLDPYWGPLIGQKAELPNAYCCMDVFAMPW